MVFMMLYVDLVLPGHLNLMRYDESSADLPWKVVYVPPVNKWPTPSAWAMQLGQTFRSFGAARDDGHISSCQPLCAGHGPFLRFPLSFSKVYICRRVPHC